MPILDWVNKAQAAVAADEVPYRLLQQQSVHGDPAADNQLIQGGFTPDFIAELKDGRILAVEYKGEPYKTNDDSREKKNVGAQWEHSSGGKCLFLMAVSDDELGRGVARQIDDKIREHG